MQRAYLQSLTWWSTVSSTICWPLTYVGASPKTNLCFRTNYSICIRAYNCFENEWVIAHKKLYWYRFSVKSTSKFSSLFIRIISVIPFKLGEFNLNRRLGGFPEIMVKFTLLAHVIGNFISHTNTDERPCSTIFPNTKKWVENTVTSSAAFFDTSCQSKLKLRRKRRNKIIKNLY